MTHLALILLAFGAASFVEEALKPVRLTNDGLEKFRPVWSPDGKELLYARQEVDGSKIWLYRLDPKSKDGPKRLTTRMTPEYHGVYAPDGASVLFVAISQSGTQGNLDLALIGLDGSDLKPVVGDFRGKLAHQDWPSWSPDGSRFAFSSTHEGNQEIYTARKDGTDLVRLTRSPGHDAHPCWSPDGRRIVFSTDRWGGLELASVGPDGGTPERLTRSPGIDDYPTLSPDGRRLAWVSHRDGQPEIYVAGTDGTNPVNVTRHPGRDTFPTWTPDSSGITFVSEREGTVDLFTLTVSPPASPGK